MTQSVCVEQIFRSSVFGDTRWIRFHLFTVPGHGFNYSKYLYERQMPSRMKLSSFKSTRRDKIAEHRSYDKQTRRTEGEYVSSTATFCEGGKDFVIYTKINSGLHPLVDIFKRFALQPRRTITIALPFTALRRCFLLNFLHLPLHVRQGQITQTENAVWHTERANWSFLVFYLLLIAR